MAGCNSAWSNGFNARRSRTWGETRSGRALMHGSALHRRRTTPEACDPVRQPANMGRSDTTGEPNHLLSARESIAPPDVLGSLHTFIVRLSGRALRVLGASRSGSEKHPPSLQTRLQCLLQGHFCPRKQVSTGTPSPVPYTDRTLSYRSTCRFPRVHPGGRSFFRQGRPTERTGPTAQGGSSRLIRTPG